MAEKAIDKDNDIRYRHQCNNSDLPSFGRRLKRGVVDISSILTTI